MFEVRAKGDVVGPLGMDHRRAWGLLRIATWSVFGRLISSTYWPSPRINLGSSRRFTLAPTSLLTGMGVLHFRVFRVLGFQLGRNSRLIFSSSVPFSLPPAGLRPRCADSRCSGRGFRQARDESRPLPAADSAAGAGARKESSLECSNRTEAGDIPKRPPGADGVSPPEPVPRSSKDRRRQPEPQAPCRTSPQRCRA